jgi:hypothetical protein
MSEGTMIVLFLIGILWPLVGLLTAAATDPENMGHFFLVVFFWPVTVGLSIHEFLRKEYRWRMKRYLKIKHRILR